MNKITINNVRNQIRNKIENQIGTAARNRRFLPNIRRVESNQVINVYDYVIFQIGNRVFGQVWNQALTQIRNEAWN